MPSLRIVLFCMAAAVCYGVAHDMVTARVCVEYFTIGHPQLFTFPADDPTLLALGWGFAATWWVGMMLGVPLAIAAQSGRRPKRSPASIIRPSLQLLGVMGLCAVLSGVTGYLLARDGTIVLVGPIAEVLPPEKHAPFLADLWAHTASYLVGLAGGVIVVARLWRSRGERGASAP